MQKENACSEQGMQKEDEVETKHVGREFIKGRSLTERNECMPESIVQVGQKSVSELVELAQSHVDFVTKLTAMNGMFDDHSDRSLEEEGYRVRDYYLHAAGLGARLINLLLRRLKDSEQI